MWRDTQGEGCGLSPGKRLRLSLERFAGRFGLPVDAVRPWESGHRQPEAAARALLTLIAADPKFVMRTLAKSA
jgi:putative transcriptional regulator